MRGSVTNDRPVAGLSGWLEEFAAIASKRRSEVQLKNAPQRWGDIQDMLMQDFVDTDPYAWTPIEPDQG